MNCAEELVKLKALIKSQDQTSAAQRKELASAHIKMVNLKAEVELWRRKALRNDSPPPNQDRDIQALEAALHLAQHRISDLEQSISWRITAPLRALGNGLARR